jgi:hypothetical protein
MNFIIGAVVALALMLVGEQGLVRWQSKAHSQQTYLVAAGQAQTIEQAAVQYVNTNQAALELAATSTTPATVTVPMLVSTQFLPSSFNPTGTPGTLGLANPYGQYWEVEVLQPTAGTLQAMLITTGGAKMKDSDAVQVVQQIGSTGGFYPQNTGNVYPANTIIGAGGGWNIPSASSSGWGVSQGYLASLLNLNGGSSSFNYLYRNAAPGNPALNTMNTPLILGVTETVGSACGTGANPTGAVAQDGTGAVVSCQGGVWTSTGNGHWRAPVSSYAALPTSGNTQGDVRLEETDNRAFAWTGGGWTALAVDQNGNLSVPGTLTAGAANVSGAANVTGTLTAGTVQSNGNVVANANVTASGYVKASGAVQAGSTVSTSYNSGWAFAATGAGNSPGTPNGSVYANDYYMLANGVGYLSTWISTVSSEISAIQTSLGSIGSSVSGLSGQVGGLSSQVSTVNNQVSTLNSQVSTVSSQESSNATAISSLTAQLNGSSSITPNGWTTLPSGLILEWGVITKQATNTATVFMPRAFPHQCFSVTVNTISPNAGNSSITDVGNVPAPGALSFKINTSIQNLPGNWSAIGW